MEPADILNPPTSLTSAVEDETKGAFVLDPNMTVKSLNDVFALLHRPEEDLLRDTFLKAGNLSKAEYFRTKQNENVFKSFL